MPICPKCGGSFDDEVSFCPRDGAKLRVVTGEFANPLAAALAPGAMVAGYRVIEVLGVGGMGIVYLAENTSLGKRFALKVLKPEYTSNARLVRRFFDEARAANKIGHENIIEVFDLVESGGVLFYVMEVLDGFPLSDLTRARQPLPLERVYGIAQQVARALAAVHEANIVHRDLKPDNVFLSQRARSPDFVKLLDFGVAKLREAHDGDLASGTQSGVILGTPAYMSPEQLEGGDIDARSDIYAFGCLLYEMLSGQRPFEAKSIPQLVMKQMTEMPAGFSELKLPEPPPAELERLVFACLAKQRDERPASMTAVASTLASLAGGSDIPVVALPPVPKDKAAANPDELTGPTQSTELIVPTRNGVLRPVAAAVVVLVLVGVGAAVVLSGGDKGGASETTPIVVTPVTVTESVAAEPLQVGIRMESTPPGAEVLVDDVVLGHTPLLHHFDRSDDARAVTFRLAGHVAVTLALTPNVDATLAAALSAEPPAAKAESRATMRSRAKRPTKKPKKSTKDGLLSPFD